MTQPGTPSRRIAQLVDDVQFPPEALYALEVYRSVPIPVLKNGGVAVAFLFGNETKVPARGRWYSPPERLAIVDVRSATVTEVRRVGPADFGRPMPDRSFDDPLPPLTVESAKERPRLRTALYDAYDLLLPAFASGRSQLSPPERRAAATYEQTFSSIVEPPLRPYYEYLGRDFTRWLASTH